MEFISEYGLLVAVATPVGVLVLINVLLAIGGESGTLLLPSLKPYPSVLAQGAMAAAAEPAVMAEPAPQLPPRTPVRAPITVGFDESDEMLARQAA